MNTSANTLCEKPAAEKVAVQIAEQISDYLSEGSIKNALNAPNLSAGEVRQLRPYLQLAISHEQACTIGDGANDVTMFQAAGSGIGYQGNPVVCALIPYQINSMG
ncbi:MAG: HAD hydrolase family protein, partial [Gammaproteobacteria bacterium]